ncbi:MAG: lipocalin-like domain-containing protein [Spirochaetales bacterium]|nr:lipocalin-like domain-containing protein [Spirochaetales bacterium]
MIKQGKEISLRFLSLLAVLFLVVATGCTTKQTGIVQNSEAPLIPTRLMNTPADYEKLGVNPDLIEPWEDGRRDDGRPGAYEWWYFDMILDDGTAVVIIFKDKYAGNPDGPMSPYVQFEVTLPTGEHFHEDFAVGVDEAFFNTESCEIRLGELASLTGDLKTYEIAINPVNGLGIELVLESMSSPWRPGSGYIGFGEEEEDYFTWLCSVPRGRVHGQLTVKGETRDISGFGYHDHQWGTVPPLMIWNHWFWIRQAFEDYSILIFDFVANADCGFARYPLVFVQDAEGNIVFEGKGDIEETDFTVDKEYVQEATGKLVPGAFTYTFRDGKSTVVYSMESQRELSAQDNYSMAPPEVRALFDQAGIKPSYTRWVGHGTLELDLDGLTSRQEGDAIYEMIFPGSKYRDY